LNGTTKNQFFEPSYDLNLLSGGKFILIYNFRCWIKKNKKKVIYSW